jgi:transposase
MTAITNRDFSTPARTLYVALELGWTKWNLAMSTGLGRPARRRRVEARDTAALVEDFARAKEKLHLPPEVPVVTCYEAGRDGFWLHRFLLNQSIKNRVIDSASIEINRRFRRAKSDDLDVGKLLSMLIREHQGEPDVWRIVRPPSSQDEDQRQLHRETLALTTECTRHINRIKGLLAGCGIALGGGRFIPRSALGSAVMGRHYVACGTTPAVKPYTSG